MKKNYLLTPGPTPIPASVLEAEARPIIHHRTPQFQVYLKEVEENLKYVFQTKNDVYLLASSGTGAMEAAVANLLSSGDQVITVQSGKFGERWTEICKAYGVNTTVIDVEWGKAVESQKIEELLSQNSDIKVVFTTLCETSTGITTDIKAIAQVTKHKNVVLVVDAISGLGAIDLKTDDWGVDVVVSGSQKGLMLAPGLGFISLSSKAWKLVESSRLPKYYFDLKKSKKSLEKTDTPFTPAISLVIALNEALKLIKQDGLENIFKKNSKLAHSLRMSMQAIGLELFASAHCQSDAITAVKVPQNIDGEKLVKIMRDEYGVTIAGGQDEMKGKIFRIAHMGYINEYDLVLGISCLETVLHRLGYTFELGQAVKTFLNIFNKEQ
ncbi:MAG: alanine--glyoxylate aminotransferase family protein [Candidatus Omnitrophota bacterium]